MVRYLIGLFALLFFTASCAAQGSTDTKDVQIARKKLRVGLDTSKYVTSITDTITAASTDRQMPTAKAVYEYGLTLDSLGGGGGGGGTNYQTMRDAGVDQTQRAAANFLDGSIVTFTLADDLPNNETEITANIAANSIGTGQIATDGVGADEIAANAVGPSELASTAVSAGSYGSGTQVATFTVDADGRLTAAANTNITTGTNYQTLRDAGVGQTARAAANYVDGSIVTFSLADDLPNNETEITANIAANSIGTGQIATDGVGADEIAANAVGPSELASTAVSAGSYGSGTQVATFTVDADGRLTAAANTNITTGTNYQTLKEDGTTLAPQPNAHFLETATINFTLSNDAVNSETEITAFVKQNSLTDFYIATDAITTDELGIGAVTAENIDQMGAASGQVIKWNGTAWAPADDEGGGGGGANLTFSGAGSPFTLNSDSGTDVTFAAGTGVQLSRATNELTITNTGDTDASDDITTASTAGGDLSGAFSNLQIVANAVGASELASTAVGAGSYGSGTQVATFTVDADGRLTAAANTNITTGTNYQTLRDAGVGQTARAAANYVDGSIVTFTLADDLPNNETEITANIAANSIGTAQIATDGVGADEIAANAVGPSELASTAVSAGSYGSGTQVATFTVDADGRLTAAANTNITTGTNYQTLRDAGVGQTQRAAANYLDGSIVTFSLADDLPNNETEITANIAANSIGTAQIATDGVGADEIAANAVGPSELASTAVAAGSYGSGTQVATFTVDADGRLTAAANTNITGVSPVGSALGNSNIWVGSAGNVAAEVPMSGDIAITATGLTAIVTGSVNSNKIANGTIVEEDIADNAVTTAKILDANVTTAKILDANVTTAKILDANVTMSKIAQAGAGTGQAIKWNGTAWAPADDAGGATDLSFTGASSPVTLNSSTGGDVTFTAGGINAFSASGANITITATEVDGSISNELQTLANTSNATTHTVTLSNAGGSVQLAEGSGITLTTTGTGLDGIVTIAATGGGGGDVNNNGNSFGAGFVVGSNDNNTVTLEQNNTAVLTIATTKNITATNSVAATNTVTDQLALNINSTGVAAANFGNGILFRGESSTTNDQEMARIRSYWTTATHASREAAFGIMLGDNAGALAEAFKFDRADDAEGSISIGTATPLRIDNDQMVPATDFILGGGSVGLTLGNTSGQTLLGNSSGTVGLGRSSLTNNAPVEVFINSTSNNSTVAGFGNRVQFISQAALTGSLNIASMDAIWTNATPATRTSDIVFNTVNSAVTNEAFRIIGNQRALVGGGANETSATLQVNSTIGGFLGPRLTNAQMLALASPVEGLEIWNTTVQGKCVYDGTDWQRLSCRPTPTVTVGTGAGTGASTSVVGNDLGGVITVTVGTSPVADATVVTLDFHTDYDKIPTAVNITAANENAGQMLFLAGGGRLWHCDESSITVDEFTIKSGTLGNTAANGFVYKIHYKVAQ